jgi:hypothetical protein
MTQKDSLATRRLVVNRLGIFILLLGVVCAGTVYWTGKNGLASRSHGWETVDNGSRDDTLSFEDSKTSSRSTEMNFGKVGVLVSIWFRRWEGLEDFERLAIMIEVSSLLGASTCFLIANRGLGS